jgi:hypothetical protein
MVAAVGPGDVASGTAKDDNVSDRRGSSDGAVGHRLHIDGRAAAIEAVGGEKQSGVAVAQAGGYGLLAEAGEERRVDRSDLAQARTAATVSASIGRKMPTRSPAAMPMDRKPFAKRPVSTARSR